ncbi:unnamed protein product [Brassica oleracea]
MTTGKVICDEPISVRDTHSITSASSSLLPPSLVNIIEE